MRVKITGKWVKVTGKWELRLGNELRLLKNESEGCWKMRVKVTEKWELRLLKNELRLRKKSNF